jgi:acyl-CoA thioesterase FadM
MIFRLIYVLLISVCGNKASIHEETRISLRVWPTDLDLNFHLTNSRYFKFMDLSRYQHIITTGVWKLITRQKLRPVLGGAAIRFRRPVPLFMKVNVTTRILGYDKKWIYIAHSVASKKQVYSKAVLRMTFINHKGKMAMDAIFLNLEQSSFVWPNNPALSDTTDLNKAFHSIEFN